MTTYQSMVALGRHRAAPQPLKYREIFVEGTVVKLTDSPLQMAGNVQESHVQGDPKCVMQRLFPGWDQAARMIMVFSTFLPAPATPP